jgi:rSAM/selenodomain-associated transferase 2
VAIRGGRVKNENGTCVPENLSVVVPALNAAATLAATLNALAHGAPAEVIVVDGGSTDATAAIATNHGARVIAAPRGRGGQIAAGVAVARGPWLLLLHADTRLSPAWPLAVAAHIARAPGAAGYFRLVLDSCDPRARRLERLVAWRCRRLALPYGDQALLLHRDLLAAVGGMPALPLMEDVALVRRLGAARLRPLPAEAVTSAAKWQRDGWAWRSARNLLFLGLYLGGVPPRALARLYR